MLFPAVYVQANVLLQVVSALCTADGTQIASTLPP